MMNPVLHPEVSQPCHKVISQFLMIYVLNQICAMHRMINTNQLPLVFQQLPQGEQGYYPEEIIASSLALFVYLFVHIPPSDKDKNLDLDFTNTKLSGRVFNSRIFGDFDVHPTLTKYACNQCKASSIPFQLGNSLSCLFDIAFKLETILLRHPIQNHGVIEKPKERFITKLSKSIKKDKEITKLLKSIKKDKEI